MGLIYHGSSTKHLSSVLEGGLEPRLDREGNWEDCPSRPDMVYLTAAYALYFASAAADLEDDTLMVVDLERLDHGKLHPDEDYIAHQTRSTTPLLELTRQIRDNLEQYQDRWGESLAKMGNVSYLGAISPHAFTRVAIITDTWISRNAPIAMSMLDPVVSPMNYAFKGSWYRHFTRWVFGDEEELPHLEEARELVQLDADLASKRIKFLTKASQDRNGIRVIEV